MPVLFDSLIAMSWYYMADSILSETAGGPAKTSWIQTSDFRGVIEYV